MEIFEIASQVGIPIFISVVFVYIMINNNNKYLEALQNSSDYKAVLDALNTTNENIAKTLDMIQKELEMLEKISTTLMNTQNEIQKNTNVNNHKIEKIYTEVKILEQFVLDSVKYQMENDSQFRDWKDKTITQMEHEARKELEDMDNGRY